MKIGYVALVDCRFPSTEQMNEKGNLFVNYLPDDLIYDRVRGEMRYDK